jgi:hypothetical protein
MAYTMRRPLTPEHLVIGKNYSVVYQDYDSDLLCSCVLRLDSISWEKEITLEMSAKVLGMKKRQEVLVPWKQIKQISLL